MTDKTENKTRKQNPKRRDNPDYIISPINGRYIKRYGRLHKTILADAMADKVKKAEPPKVMAEGTRKELYDAKKKLTESGALDLENYDLKIRSNKLVLARKIMKTNTSADFMRDKFIETTVENREIIRSEMSEDNLVALLLKVFDAKIMGQDIDISEEYAAIKDIEKRAKKPDTLANRARDAYAKSKNTRAPRRRKFKVMPRPPTDYDSTTCYDSTTAFDETDESD